MARRTYERPLDRSDLFRPGALTAKTDSPGQQWTHDCSHERPHGLFSALCGSGDSFTLRRVEELLLAWFSQNGRDLPWRKTRDPYAILVSEVMSQQYPVENEELPAMQAFSA